MLKHYYNEFARKLTLANESFDERFLPERKLKSVYIDILYIVAGCFVKPKTQQ